MREKVVSDDPYMPKYYLDRYKTQKMFDKAVAAFLPTLEFVPDWFAAKKMIKKLGDDIFCSDDIIFVNEDACYVTFFSDEMAILTVDLLIILISMISILMKMILKLLFMPDL